MITIHVVVENGQVVRSLASEPLPPVCPLCSWHHGWHALWCPDPGYIVREDITGQPVSPTGGRAPKERPTRTQ